MIKVLDDFLLPNETGWREAALEAQGKARVEGVTIIELKAILRAVTDD